MKFSGFGGKLAESLKNTAGTLLETGSALADKARDSEALRKAGALTKDTISQLGQNKFVQEAQQTVAATVSQIRASEVGQKIESAASGAVGITREKVASISEQIRFGDDAQWMTTVRKTIKELSEADAVVFLRVLHPEALVKAMYCEETIAILRKPENHVDLAPSEALYPGVQKTLNGHVILDSANATIAAAISKLSPAPVLKTEHGASTMDMN